MPSGSALNDFTNFLQNLFFDFGKTSANARAGSKTMAATTELLANRADVDSFVFRTHAHPHFALGKFFEKDGDDHAANCAKMIDQTFVVFRKNTQLCGGFLAEAKSCHSIASSKTHRSQKFAQQFQAAAGIVLVQLLTYFSNVQIAIAHEFRGDLKRAPAGLWILKRPCVSGDRGMKIFCNVMIQRKALALDEVENDFSSGRGAWIEDHQIAIARIAEMMIDVDPDFCRPNRSNRSSQPVLNFCVERNGDIEVFCRRGRFREQIRVRQVGILFEHAVFVPHANLLAYLLKRQCERKLTAQRIPVRSNMTQNREMLMLAQDLADLLERGVAHSSSLLPFSRSCKISRTRAPRSMESSR